MHVYYCTHTYTLILMHIPSTLGKSPFPARRSEELRSQEENEKLLRRYDYMLASEVGDGGDGEEGYTISESDRNPLVTIESDDDDEEEIEGDGRSVVPLSLPFRGFNRPAASTVPTAND